MGPRRAGRGARAPTGGRRRGGEGAAAGRCAWRRGRGAADAGRRPRGRQGEQQADGVAGRRTVAAIKLYQEFAGLPVDGKATVGLLHDVRDVSKKEVTGLRLKNVKTGEQWDFPASAMFRGIGHIPNAKVFAGQLDADKDGYLITRDYVFTKVPGVFASGDVQDRRYRQAITAAATGCMAAMEVEKFLEEQGH